MITVRTIVQKIWQSVYQHGPSVLATLFSFNYIMTPIVLLMAGTGFILMWGGPILDGVAVGIAGLIFSAFAALTLDVTIEFLLGARQLVIHQWRRHRPPHLNDEISDLPVVDESEEIAHSKAIRFATYSIIIYLAMFAVAGYLAIVKPIWVLSLSNSPFLEVIIAIIFAIFQIPYAVLDFSILTDAIPNAQTQWDAIIRAVLMMPAVPTLLVSVTNYRFCIQRRKIRLYREIANEIESNRERTSSLWPNSFNVNTSPVTWDIFRAFFIASLVYVSLIR